MITGKSGVTFGLDSALELSCSSQGNPLPRLTWSIAPQATLQAIQLPTNFTEPALSNAIIDINSITAITHHTVTCSTEVTDKQGSTLMASTAFTFIVAVILSSPQGLNVTAITTNAISLEWQPPLNGIISAYAVRFTKDNSYSHSKFMSMFLQAFIVVNLLANRSYFLA